MKYPINADILYEAYLQESGDSPDDMLKKLYSIMVGMINSAYQDGRRDALKEAKV